MSNADALLVIGEGDKAAPLTQVFAKAGKKVFNARIVPQGDTRWLGVLPVIGFAGIARPEKFFMTLQMSGARLEGRRAFPDHHHFTEKDWVRLPEDRESPLGELKFRSRPLPIALQFEDEGTAAELLAAKTKAKS